MFVPGVSFKIRDKMENYEAIKTAITEEAKNVKDEVSLALYKAKFIGKKGIITEMFSSMKNIADKEQKKEIGLKINSLKQLTEQCCDDIEAALLKAKKAEILAGTDVTLPAYDMQKGSLHPLAVITREINSIFQRMGFTVESGPEIESEYYNFKTLNFPENHPAMDMHDTFYFDSEHLLRTHTSPVQVRAMKKHRPPLKIIAPGRVYRRDALDATHSHVFHQIEVFMVDKNVRFSDLKGILELFANEIFGKGLKLRFRPSFFPFTEPSAEVDVQCVHCRGRGCPVCKKTGWLEILGAGMIHPNVLRNVDIDPETYSGFAFGMGVERIAMLKYEIDDMRLFYENDMRFLKQFG